ncbi:MAG: flavodoxin family protein [Candidatus Limnocylindria bacterium]
MNSLVVYASRSGNTRAVAEAIATQLSSRGPAQLLAADEVGPELPPGLDLLVVGGPTEGHGMTEPMTALLDRLNTFSVRGIAAAAFDTRVRWPRWLSGSAAEGIGQRLEQLGARVVVPAESFMVSTKPVLEPGELKRAADWASNLADLVAAAAGPALVTQEA